jgi:hypothetical protein
MSTFYTKINPVSMSPNTITS